MAVDPNEIINTVVSGVVAVKVLDAGTKMITGVTQDTPKKSKKKKSSGGLNITNQTEWY